MCDKICPAKQALLNRLRTLYYFAQVDGKKQVKAERHIRDLTGELQAAYGAIISLSADNASLAAQIAELEEDSLSVAVASGTVMNVDWFVPHKELTREQLNNLYGPVVEPVDESDTWRYGMPNRNFQF